jgi:hypothetical protein
MLSVIVLIVVAPVHQLTELFLFVIVAYCSEVGLLNIQVGLKQDNTV